MLSDAGAKLTTYDLELGFDNRPVDWLLQRYLPHIDNIIRTFETIGHIAHMNLRGDEMLEAKYLMGAIVLEVRIFHSLRSLFRDSNHIGILTWTVFRLVENLASARSLIRLVWSIMNFEFCRWNSWLAILIHSLLSLNRDVNSNLTLKTFSGTRDCNWSTRELST